MQLKTPRLLKSAVVALTATVPGVSFAEGLTPVEAQAIAREAYVYGFPIVGSYSAMYASAIDRVGERYRAPFNVLKHGDVVPRPGDTSVVTPSMDTLYSHLWLDLRSEPIVLGVPRMADGRYYSIQLIDLYKFTFDYIGMRTTGTDAGRYLIVGPNWNGETPASVNKVIRCETEFASAVYRTELRGPDDLESVRRIQSHYTVQALSDLTGQPTPNPAPAIEFPRPDSITQPNLQFFSMLNFLLPFCPPVSSETELMARLARIGISATAPLDATGWNPDIQEAMQQGAQEGDAAIRAAAATLKAAEVVGTRDYLQNDYMKRAVAATLGGSTNSKEEALDQLYLTDAEGKPLDASDSSYVLKFGKNELPPVNAFWSLTVYDGQSKGLVDNPIDRYRITSYMLPDLTRDVDGGLTLYVQRDSPAEGLAGNWLPAPSGPFYMVMRLYWPKPEAYDGSWVPPLVWQVAASAAQTAAKPEGAEGAEEVQPSVLVDAPQPEMERPTIWGEPTEVEILIYVIDVDEVNSADQSFAASVYYEARWKNPFLRHKGPGPINRGLSEVWNPRLTIVGQQMAWKSYPESVEIQPDGTVIHRQKVWGRFSQPLNLRDFPFDSQWLSIQIVAAGLMEEHIKTVALVRESGRTSAIANQFSLPDFDVVSWDASPAPYFPARDGPGVAGYEMKIHVSRQATYYILKVIIPLCLIVVMSWLPRWMDSQQAGTNIGLSTSAFLTLVAYLFAITVLLPRVSYITRMDRFILLSTLTVFAGLIQTVASTVMLKHHQGRLSERIDGWSRFIYPILLVLILAFSFVL